MRVAGYALGVLISLGTATILVRKLGVTDFGRYVTAASLAALVGGLTEAGIYVYGIREFTLRDDAERRRLMANLLAMRLSLTSAGLGVAILFALVAGYRWVIVVGTVVAGSSLLVQVAADVLSVPLQAQLRLARLTAIDLARRTAVLVLVGGLALLDSGILLYLAASTVAGVLALVLLARSVRRSLAVRLRFDLRAWRTLFAETLPYAIAVSIGAIYLYVTVIVMSLAASSRQTGLFATSFRVTQVALAVPALLLTAVFPLMFSVEPPTDAARRERFEKVFTVAVICGVWMSIGAALGAQFIISVVAGPDGRGAVSVLQIQGLVLTATFLSTAASLAFVAARRYRPMIVASSAALILDIVLTLVLVPHLGARGGALADVITESLVAAGLTATLVRTAPEHRLPIGLAPRLLLAAGAAIAVWAIPIGSAAHAVLGSAVYLVLLLATRALPREVLDSARRLRSLRTSF